MKKIFVIIIICLGTQTSCVINNFTKDKKTTCEIHKVALKKTWVRINYGPAAWGPPACPYSLDYIPVTLGCERPRIGPVIRQAKVYSCDSCNKVCGRVAKL